MKQFAGFFSLQAFLLCGTPVFAEVQDAGLGSRRMTVKMPFLASTFI